MDDNHNQSNNESSNNNNNNTNNNDNKKKPSATIIILILSVLLTLAFWQAYSRFKDSGKEKLTYDEFLTMLEEGNVQNVKIYGNEITFEPAVKDENAVHEVSYSVVKADDYNLVERLDKAGVTFEEIDEGGSIIINTILSYGIMIVAFYVLMMLIMKSATKSGGVMGVGRSNAKMYVQTETGVTFKDVAGQEEAKESLTEMVDFLEKPEKYLQIGAKLPRGALLVGPPGTGKTLLAKAVAGEAKVPFFSLSGSDFVELYVGVGAARVRDLFKRANAMAPCIIFIDEIDAIGRSRDTRHSGGDTEREQTLNQLLSEMDGFDTSKGIVVLAATNRPEVLDKALLRPGRFDRRIIVSKPDLQGRIDTIKVHMKNVKIDETVNLRELALATVGAVGADLANIVNEAALLAVRNGREYVSQADLLGSVEVVFAGKEKKEKLLSKKEKEIVAYHEVGHALVSALQKNTMPIQRITIVPRTGGALGYVWQVPEEEKQLESKKELEEEIVICLAGRAAEELKFDSVTSGAANDIEKATNIARTMITMYGMSDKFGMVQLESITGQYLDNRRVLNCSYETETKVDTEVKNMIKAAYEKALKLLKKNMSTLDAIAKTLYEKENITGEEFMKLYEKHQKVKLKNTTDSGAKSDGI
ncbi:MAG: ATP-dependent zinc metalloprotease FtsH [Clostridium sp.]|nr:ATP-dependent zinc metalloprotease FtsH [Clostridium sp.]MCM1398442.1 ATP-dependent zinc metalloprotease FtsH [Clostridium sp.]MCM1458893.1 ATP-dependent zinc metalloprotease FtsH [Bacteroides sp.]